MNKNKNSRICWALEKKRDSVALLLGFVWLKGTVKSSPC